MKKKKKRDLIDDPWHYVVENFEGILVRRGSDRAKSSTSKQINHNWAKEFHVQGSTTPIREPPL